MTGEQPLFEIIDVKWCKRSAQGNSSDVSAAVISSDP